MSRVVPRTWAAGLAACLALLASGCASREPPSADRPAPAPPALAGRDVMVLPVQAAGRAAPARLDEELAFWLAQRGSRVRWTFPPQLDRVLARTPALDIHIRALSVSSFGYAEVRRIGDPLFGDLRRLGAMVEARYALLPVAGGYVPAATGAGRVELAAAVIDTHTGRVQWFGVVGGERGAPDSAPVVASAARALARALFPGTQ